jgi:hypothetical protein
MQVKLIKGGAFTNPGDVLDLAPGMAAKLVKEKRAEYLVPENGRDERMVPRPGRAERMNRKG